MLGHCRAEQRGPVAALIRTIFNQADTVTAGIRDIEQAIRPRDYRVFAGVIDRHQWPLFSRLFFYAVGGRLGDNRDWAANDAWTESIARSIGRA